jgi:8-hydroxy-5-deazaflavin:NADPH oxidoreductase
MQIGVLGATGPEGRGFAARLASLGHEVVAGSRDRARAEATVAKIRERWGGRVAGLKAGVNGDAAAAADIIVIAVQWEGAVETVRQHAPALAGRVVVSIANGVTKQDQAFLPVLAGGVSLAEAMQAAAPDARVAAAFQHIPAAALARVDDPVEGDVIVCADDEAARAAVLGLVADIPTLRGFEGGPLANAVGIETFAALLLTVNMRHGGKASLRLVGVEPRAPEKS